MTVVGKKVNATTTATRPHTTNAYKELYKNFKYFCLSGCLVYTAVVFVVHVVALACCCAKLENLCGLHVHELSVGIPNIFYKLFFGNARLFFLLFVIVFVIGTANLAC